MRLLVIEDEEALRQGLARGFQKIGYSVDCAERGPEGFALAGLNAYDLILLDLNLPDMDGLEVLRRIRERDWQQKILILSARSTFRQRIDGLDMGANDYLVKPFDFGELEARVRNLLRRSFVQQGSSLCARGILLNTVTRSAQGPGETPLDLTKKEFAILEYLLLNQGRPVSAEELIEHVWSEESDPFSNAVKVHISLIRRKLAMVGETGLLETVRGVGYLIREDGEGRT